MANDLEKVLQMEVRSEAPCHREFGFTVPAPALVREKDLAVRDFALMVNLPGFRRGRAPAAMVLKRFADEIGKELKRRILNAAFGRIVEDKTLDVITCMISEDAEIKDDEDFKFTLSVDVAPEFEVGDYASVRMETPALEVPEEKVEERVSLYRSIYASFADVDGPAAEGDLLRADYKADFELPDGAGPALRRQVADENGYILLTEPEPMPGAIAALTGAEKGGEYEFDSVFPEQFREPALAGKTLKYRVKVHKVQRKKMPTDGELCAKLQVSSLDGFRETLRGIMLQEAGVRRANELTDKVYEAVSAQIPEFELPPHVLEIETERELRRLAGGLVKNEADVDDFKNRIEEHRRSAEESARKKLRRSFILRRIARLEHIELSRSDVDESLRDVSRGYGWRVKDLRGMLEMGGGMDAVHAEILDSKVLEFLVTNAVKVAK